MTTPDYVQSIDLTCHKTLKTLLNQMTRVRERYSCTDKSTNHQHIVPFDLDDVARAYDGTLTSIVRYLEAESSD